MGLYRVHPSSVPSLKSSVAAGVSQMPQNVRVTRKKRLWRVRKHRSGTWIFAIRFTLSVLSPFYAELVKSSSWKATG
jgi:hypothetical protein